MLNPLISLYFLSLQSQGVSEWFLLSFCMMERSPTVWIDVTCYQMQIWNGQEKHNEILSNFLCSLLKLGGCFILMCPSFFLPKSISPSLLTSGISRSNEVGRGRAESNLWALGFPCSTSTTDLCWVKQCSPATGSSLVLTQIHVGAGFCKHEALWDLPPSLRSCSFYAGT